MDEFQDTNRLQYRWLKLLAGPGASLFAVGDDDQSIYAFRGANVGNMADFERDFKVAKVVRLEQNYRSHGNILDAANALIAHNKNRLGKNLWTATGAGEPLRVFEGQSDTDEARWMVEEVKALQRDGSRLDADRGAVPLERPVARARARAVLARHCPTASTAGCASSSAPRSSTRSPTCASSPRRTTTTRSCAW